MYGAGCNVLKQIQHAGHNHYLYYNILFFNEQLIWVKIRRIKCESRFDMKIC